MNVNELMVYPIIQLKTQRYPAQNSVFRAEYLRLALTNIPNFGRNGWCFAIVSDSSLWNSVDYHGVLMCFASVFYMSLHMLYISDYPQELQ